MWNVFRGNRHLSTLITTLLTVTLSSQPFSSVRADELQNSGFDGQQFGQHILSEFDFPALSDNTLMIQLGEDNQSITLESLFPSLDKADELSSLTQSYGSEAGMQQLSDSKRMELETEESVTGDAFRVLQKINDRARPDLSDDPIWSLSDAIYADPNLLAQSFPACDLNPHIPEYQQCDRYNVPIEACTIVHEYRAGIIEHVAGPLNLSSCGEGCLEVWIGQIGNDYWQGNCTIFEQSITVRVVNPQAITSAILEYAKWDDYMQVWIGDKKVWSGPNENFPPETPGACELATDWQVNPNTDVKSYFSDVVSGTEVPIKIRVSVTGRGEGFARIKVHYDPKKIVMDDLWVPESCIDLANLLPNRFTDYSINCVDMPNQNTGCTVVNGVTVCEADFLPSPVEGISPLCRRVDVQVQPASYEANHGTLCTSLEKQAGCGFIASTCVEVDSDGVCKQYDETYDCGFESVNPECIVSELFPSEFEECKITETVIKFDDQKYLPDLQPCEKIYQPSLSIASEIEQTYSSCDALETNPECKFIGKVCSDEENTADGETYCALEHIEYDCGQTVTINNAKVETSYQCEGPIRCLGHDCLKPESVTQANFAEALAMLNLAQSMTNDMTCSGLDGTSNVTCELFKGEAQECKKAIGGIVNCCDKPGGVSLSDYITLLSAVNRLDTATMALDPSNAFYGAWNTLRQPMVESWSLVKQPFTSSWDALMGSTPSTAANLGAEQAAASFMQSLTNSTAQWIGQTFGSGAQSALFSNVGGTIGADGVLTGGNFALNGMVGTVLSTVMTAYMIYSVTLILIKLIWQCENDEFELGVKRELRSCHSVGSYCRHKVLGVCVEKREAFCCFSAPLPRILQEQVRPQLGKSWGTPQNPQCDGLAVEDISQIDWSLVNLDEWIAILAITDHLPDIDRIDLDTLTGKGSAFDVDGNRSNVLERLQERLE